MARDSVAHIVKIQSFNAAAIEFPQLPVGELNVRAYMEHQR